MPTPVIDQILKFNRGRDPALVKKKLKRMAASPFCFFRGADHLFAAAWRELGPADAGPAVFCCGDLHLENFGIFAADDGRVHFGINDFDEALIAPASFDLVRCAASIFLAAEEWQLLPIQAASMTLAFVSSYQQAVTKTIRMGTPGDIILGQHKQTVFDLIGDCLGNQGELLRTFTENSKAGTPQIIRDKKHPELEMDVRSRIERAVEAYGKQHKHRKEYEVLDVTGRIAGIGSLGLNRYTVLVRGNGTAASRRLLDVKLATPSSVLAASRFKRPTFSHNPARRIVAAQRQLQGFSARGLDFLRIGRADYRVREMIPDENRFSLDAFKEQPEQLSQAVELAGQITGWAHFRGIHPPNRSATRRLSDWAMAPTLDSIVTSAIRFADHTKSQFKDFAAYELRNIDRSRSASARTKSNRFGGR